MGRERKIKPKKTPVIAGSDVADVSKRGWVIKERKNRLLDRSASSPITIERVTPEISAGRYAVKREVGDTMEVQAAIFKDGHDLLKAVVMCRHADSDEWWEAPMTEINHGLALWSGSLWFGDNTRYVYTIEAWVDGWKRRRTCAIRTPANRIWLFWLTCWRVLTPTPTNTNAPTC